MMANLLRFFFLAAFITVSSGAYAQEGNLGQNGASGQDNSSAQEAAVLELLENGQKLVSSGQSAAAIAEFDKAIAIYQAAFKNDKRKLYSAHTRAEALMYLTEAANTNTDAVVVSPNFADAYYLKGYALMELKDVAAAKAALQRALELAPHNAVYWGELGADYEAEHDWQAALSAFKSEADASEFAPDAQKNVSLSHAWRGMGYVYVELNQLDEAEKWYRKCLDLDGNDEKAKSELLYIKQQREKK
ncbi:MAG: tetratricopeptide repeat protein [Gallionellaceae bacterium]|jgi:tetratricopeptide (TPR) repeat protein|nr:tetratricopeptide repeat protein [Gallionellaceae bacterium]